MDTVRVLAVEAESLDETMPNLLEAYGAESDNVPHMTKPLSKYAAKKLALKDEVQNAHKIKNNKAVSLEDSKKHKKVSRNLLLSLRNEQTTVVCEQTGIVSILAIPAITGKALVWDCPLASLPNARGIVQEGYDYLNKLDTQIVSGLFITLAREYDLIRTMVDQSGAVTNAILRTASKEKLIQACLLVETYIHSLNHVYQPKLSLVYDQELKDNGAEPRLTEWMRLVNDAIEKPDLSEYDENALLNRPMRSIAEIRRDDIAARKEAAKAAKAPKDKNFKERAAMRKDIKEAKNLVSNLKDTISAKMTAFMKQLFTEESYLTVDLLVIEKLVEKLSTVEHASAKRIIEILNTDRSKLRAENLIDDLDDPLMAVVDSVAERSDGTYAAEEQSEQYVDAMDHADSIEELAQQEEHTTELAPYAGEFEPIVHANTAKPNMPEGLSFVEKMLWKKRNGV